MCIRCLFELNGLCLYLYDSFYMTLNKYNKSYESESDEYNEVSELVILPSAIPPLFVVNTLYIYTFI